MTDEEWQLLKQSHAGGKWGFQLDIGTIGNLSTLGGQTLPLTTVLLPAYAAREWTVNLRGMQYASGAQVVSANSQFPNSQDNNVAFDLKCRVDYGVDSATESVLIDYPWAGGTFQLMAASIRLYAVFPQNLPGQLALRPARIGGWLTPYASGKSPRSPTYTQYDATLLPDSDTMFPAPKRACAFRLSPSDEGSVMPLILVQAVTFGQVNQVDVTHSALAPNAALPPTGEALTVTDSNPTAVQAPHLYPQRDLWVPLVPQASGIMIRTFGTLPSSTALNIQWLLDVG